MEMLNDYRYLLLYIIPILMTAFFLFRTYSRSERQQWRDDFASFKWQEAGIAFVVFVLVVHLSWLVGRDWRIGSFNEQIGGFITSMHYEDGSREVSYNCMCSTDKDGNEHCSTCYRTEYYRTFYISNNTGDWWSNNTWSQEQSSPCMNCDPYQVPPAYATAYIGKPLSLDHSYDNFIAAVNEDYYKATYTGLSSYLPDICPATQYDVGTSGRKVKALPLGFANTSLVFNQVLQWNFADPSTYNPAINVDANVTLAQIPMYMDTTFGYLGTHKQADTYVYVVNSTSTEYADMCLAKWKYGAKNSIYVFIFGQETGNTFVVSDVKVAVAVDGTDKNTGLNSEKEGNNYHMKYDIRNNLLQYFSTGGSLERENVLRIIFTNVDSEFERQEMSTYKDLRKQVVPTNGFMIGLAILAFIVSLVSHLIFADTKE